MEVSSDRRLDVGKHMRFSTSAPKRPGSPESDFKKTLEILPVSSTSRVGFVGFRICPEDVSENALEIIRIGGMSPFDAAPGAVWSRIDLILEKKGHLISMKLNLNLFWNETPSPRNGLRQITHRGVSQAAIDSFYPISRQEGVASSPLDFYEAAYVPSKANSPSAIIEIPGLDATLFPYQRRTLEWLLRREGVQWSGNGNVLQTYHSTAPLSDSSRKLKDLDGRDMFLSDIFHTISTSNDQFRQAELAVKGGILAEEMGLGKTVEILALILLHTRPSDEPDRTHNGSSSLIPSGATLIVTPESLRQQWMSEISRHAPGLRYTFYQGCKREGREGDDAAQRLAEYDVVITTHSILSAELHFTTEPSQRPRRHAQAYERPKSPLIQVAWWRLCLDEAQMVENSMSQAAKIARVIPRDISWAISGTPVKDDVQDLYGLLMFLGYEPLCSAPHLWKVVLKQKDLFRKLFHTLALRHTKALVRDEIALPPQHRYVISVPFTAVEEQHYQTLFRDMADACGVDNHGNPIIDEWAPERFYDTMRIWLNRLRQTALHPEVGPYNRRTLGQSKDRPMRTVDEVLDAMIEQSENAIRADERALISAKLTRGQLLENSPRVREALVIWQDVMKETEKMVEVSRAELQTELANFKGKGIAQEETSREGSKAIGSEDDEDDGEGEIKGRIGELRRKLRSNLEMQHKAVFFCANAFFQIRDNPDLTEPDSDEFKRLKKLEDDGYEEAKTIRREILAESHKKATRLMNKISRKAVEQSFAEIPELGVEAERGIESSTTIEKLECLYDELNEQANTIDEWREAVIQLLLKSLLDEEDELETTGEELVDSAKIQDELMVYSQALRGVIADRQDAMTGQTNELIKLETQNSLRMAREGQGPAPEKLIELMEIRGRIKPQAADTSMRGAISEFRSLVSRLNNEEHKTQRVVAEHAIAVRHLQATQAALQEQTKIVTALESEVERFSATMNARLEYYRQLQSVSDSVLPYDGAKTNEAMARLIKAEEGIQRKVASGGAKHRYLIHLKEAGSKSQEPRMCVICQATFETGVLTVCGHQFCKECMMHWFKAHRNCPVCKRHLTSSDLHDITLRPQQLKLHSGESTNPREDDSPTSSPRDGTAIAKQTAIYSAFNPDKLAEIKNIELDGPSYTTKVDTLIRHLLWLRESDPGAKSIVFSQ
jgi:E3 ubiquitin-protein ligase SHPRH